MSLKQYLARFEAELRRNPALPAPDACPRTVEELHDWKNQTRAYDAARLALNIVTPREVQRENSCIQTDRSIPRVLRFAQHAR